MVNDNKLIERITTCLEEFGMPKFQDRFPAMSVLQILKDSGYLSEPNAGTPKEGLIEYNLNQEWDWIFQQKNPYDPNKKWSNFEITQMITKFIERIQIGTPKPVMSVEQVKRMVMHIRTLVGRIEGCHEETGNHALIDEARMMLAEANAVYSELEKRGK
jgi:hypothetical protein